MKKREKWETVVHELKCDNKCFIGVYNDAKHVEIRLDDRDYMISDYILLRQTHDSEESRKNVTALVYTGRTALLKITHIQKGYGLREGYVALSFRKLD